MRLPVVRSLAACRLINWTSSTGHLKSVAGAPKCHCLLPRESFNSWTNRFLPANLSDELKNFSLRSDFSIISVDEISRYLREAKRRRKFYDCCFFFPVFFFKYGEKFIFSNLQIKVEQPRQVCIDLCKSRYCTFGHNFARELKRSTYVRIAHRLVVIRKFRLSELIQIYEF